MEEAKPVAEEVEPVEESELIEEPISIEGASSLEVGMELDMDAYKQEVKEALEKAEALQKEIEKEHSKKTARTTGLPIEGFVGKGTNISPYLIGTAEGLRKFATIVNSGNTCKNTYFKLTSDINMYTEKEGLSIPWIPMEEFQGTLDGRNYTISNLDIKATGAPNDYRGFFSKATGATIENVKLELFQKTILGSSSGALIGSTKGSTISNCSVKGDLEFDGHSGGGLIGYAFDSTIINSSFHGNIEQVAEYSVGGIVGTLVDNSKVEGCITNGKIIGREQVGGMIGRLLVTKPEPGQAQFAVSEVKSNHNKAEIYGVSKKAGGIIGEVLNTGDSRIRVNVQQVANTGKVEAGAIAGGVIGFVSGNVILLNSYNNANITVTLGSVAGGVVGNFNYEKNPYASLRMCYNAGKIEAKNKMMRGGITGCTGSSITKSYMLRVSELSGMGAHDQKLATDNKWLVTHCVPSELRNFCGDIKNQTQFILDTKNFNDGYPILKSINYYPERELEKNEFIYASGTEADYIATYYYDNAYFKKNSLKYDASLGTMSLNLAISAFASNEAFYEHKSKNVEQLLRNTGFQDIEINQAFKEKPKRNSIGVIAGHKNIREEGKDYTLIAVTMRGAGYDAEWSGNFLMGGKKEEDSEEGDKEEYKGDHEGFSLGKQEVFRFLNEYVTDQKHTIKGDIKLWITGYSRASAVANLVAGSLLSKEQPETITGCDLQPRNLYAYGFEVPAGTTFDNTEDQTSGKVRKEFKYIHNIINPHDPVPKVAPEAFEFTRYGNFHVIPTKSNVTGYDSMQEKMLEKYEALTSVDKYVVEKFRPKTIGFAPADGSEEPQGPQGPHVPPGRITVIDNPNDHRSQEMFLGETIDKLSKGVFEDRKHYVEAYQSILCDAAGSAYEVEPDAWSALLELILKKMWNEVEIKSGKLHISKVKVKEIVMGSLKELEIESISEESIDNIGEAISEIFNKFVLKDKNAVITIIENSQMLAEAHYPELCLSWMQAMDENYTLKSELANFSEEDAYRIASINCPVDVEVYNSSNALVASIKADVPQEIEGSSIISSVNEDGEKQVYLPAEETYTMKLTATGDSKMTYAVNEFNYVVYDVTKIVSNYDVKIKTGEIFTSTIPAFNKDDTENGTQKGSSAKYELLDPSGNVIKPNVSINGEEAGEASYQVEVESENPEQGLVLGGGTRMLGSFAQVTAQELEGYVFTGWYVEDEQVSDEKEYRFRVEKDIKLVAKFKSEKNEFSYARTNMIDDNKVEYYYEDDYFTADSSQYNPNLSTMSLNFAMSAFASNEAPYENQNKNVKKLLNDTGFKNIECNDSVTLKPEKNSIGISIGSKVISDKGVDSTLIAVTTRGAGFGAELAASFLVGEEGQHEGFSATSKQVLDFLNQYIEKNNDKIKGDVKIWMAGYGRPGAAINLAAGSLMKTKKIGSSTIIKPENLYAYCFAVPAGALKNSVGEGGFESSSDYNSIHNIINANDPVSGTTIDPFGFVRYGVDHQIPTITDSANYESMEDVMWLTHEEMGGEIIYRWYFFKIKKFDSTSSSIQEYTGSQNDFLAQRIDQLSKKVFINQSEYVKSYQNILCDLSSSLYEEEPKLWNIWSNRFTNLFFYRLMDDFFADEEIVNVFLKNELTNKELKEKFEPKIKEIVISSLRYMTYSDPNKHDINVDLVSEETIDKIANVATTLVVDFASKDLNATISFVGNVEFMLGTQEPEVYLAWMRSMDPNYTPAGELNHFGNGSYRVVSVLTDAININVFETDSEHGYYNREWVGGILNGVPQDQGSGSRYDPEEPVFSAIGEAGEKLFYLPKTKDYTILLDGELRSVESPYEYTVQCTVNEFNAEAGGIDKILSFPTEKVDRSTTSRLEIWKEETLREHTFFSRNSVSLIDSDISVSGEDALNANYQVDVRAENSNQGIAMGRRTYSLGSFAQINARPAEGFVFKGWYVGDEKISDEKEYHFRVEKDVKLVAKFKSENETITKKRSIIEISTAEELRAIPHDSALSYKLMNDIDLQNEPWEPIQNFSGIFDGSAYMISNLTIHKPNSENVGFFGNIYDAEIRNIRIEGVTIEATGSTNVGVLVGKANVKDASADFKNGNRVIDCFIDIGTVSGETNVGGLIGQMDTATRVYRCCTKNQLTVQGVTNTGGFFGLVTYTHSKYAKNLQHSYSEANVKGRDFVGGLTGHSDNAYYQDSYSNGDVSGETFVGGLLGYHNDRLNYYNDIKACYFSGTGENITSIIGQDTTALEMSSRNRWFYFNKETTSVMEPTQRAKTTVEMKQEETYWAFGFASDWAIDEGKTYPYLQALPNPNIMEERNALGTINNPYLISTPEEFSNIRSNLTAHYKLTEDIDLAGFDWNPIGYFAYGFTYQESSHFQGSLDGNGYTIRNAKVRGNHIDGATGLFAASLHATFKNIRLENFDVRGNGTTGGLVGIAQGGTLIENCSIDNQSKVVGSDPSLLGITSTSHRSRNSGGLFGLADDLKIYDSHSSATVGDMNTLGDFSTEYVGGIGGYISSNLVMERCYFDGTVYGRKKVYGLVTLNGFTRTVDSYFSGKVIGLENVAPLTGNYGEYKNSYTTGTIEGEAGSTAPFSWTSKDVVSTYFNNERFKALSHFEKYGRTTEQMKKEKTYVGWDFDNVWYIDEGESEPKLRQIEK